ncbi:MAG: choice-of-anchor D domain-containing protein, partial [Bacteroidia bacterium]|nr:choice-of-anchor D domain-containing protein [Bacteroidia bacterium]
DNLTIDHSGHVLLQEDPGNQTYIAKVWEYNTQTDVLTQVGEHDANRFITGGINFLTQDEESSGIIDVQEILGPGMFLIADQAHYAQPGQVVEGGQLLAFYNPNTANTNTEINVKGNGNNIATGNTSTSISDNTDFGSVNIASNTNKSFVVENTSFSTLYVSNIYTSGNQANEFTLVGNKSFTVAANASETITVQFAPTAAGTRTANIHLVNNDYNEGTYTFRLLGNGNLATGVSENNTNSDFMVYPNPTNHEITLEWNGTNEEQLEISIYDLQGKLHMQPVNKKSVIGNQKVSLPTTGLSDGVYFVKLQTENKISQIKIIVIH